MNRCCPWELSILCSKKPLSSACLQASLLGAEELVKGKHDLDAMLVLFTP